jgi:hypothetical protein
VSVISFHYVVYSALVNAVADKLLEVVCVIKIEKKILASAGLLFSFICSSGDVSG